MIIEGIMQFVVEIIGEIILSFIDFPGAYIHWHLREKKFDFKEIKERYFGINLLISCVLYAIIISIFI